MKARAWTSRLCTVAFGKTLTNRLEGNGMRWNKANAEAMMALGALEHSGQWANYWDLQYEIAA